MAGLPDVTVTPQLTLSVRRCWTCGRYWAAEQQPDATCPYCAAGAVEKAVALQRVAERSAAATRGALAKSKALVEAYRADAKARVNTRSKP